MSSSAQQWELGGVHLKVFFVETLLSDCQSVMAQDAATAAAETLVQELDGPAEEQLMDQMDKALDNFQSMDQCSWCLLYKQVLELKHHGKKMSCKNCLAVQQMMYRHLGSYEECISGFTDQEQSDFFQEAARAIDVQGGGRWKLLKAVLVEKKSKVIAREQSVAVAGDYVPMSLWEARGWTKEDVLSFNDYEELPNGTRAYRCHIKSKADTEVKRTLEESLLTRERECKRRRVPKAKAKGMEVEKLNQDDWCVASGDEPVPSSRTDSSNMSFLANHIFPKSFKKSFIKS